MPKPNSGAYPGQRTQQQQAGLPKYSEGMAAALLAAREAVMGPIRPVLREFDLTEQQWRLLRVLLDQGPMEISHAAAASMIMAPSVTRIVKDLSQRQLIEKVRHPDDARRSILRVTRHGQHLVNKTASQTAELLAAYQTTFGKRRFQALITELRALEQAIQNNP